MDRRRVGFIRVVSVKSLCSTVNQSRPAREADQEPLAADVVPVPVDFGAITSHTF